MLGFGEVVTLVLVIKDISDVATTLVNFTLGFRPMVGTDAKGTLAFEFPAEF